MLNIRARLVFTSLLVILIGMQFAVTVYYYFLTFPVLVSLLHFFIFFFVMMMSPVRVRRLGRVICDIHCLPWTCTFLSKWTAWKSDGLMGCLRTVIQKRFMMSAMDLKVLRFWAREYADGLTGADKQLFCRAIKFNMCTCLLYPVNNNTFTRRGYLLLLVCATQCLQKTFQEQVFIISVWFRPINRYARLIPSGTWSRK